MASTSASASAAAPSPFIGRRVRLALTSGGSYTGAITALDPATRAIEIRDDRTTAVFTIRGNEVRDMQLLDQPAPAPAPSASSTSAPVAGAANPSAQARTPVLPPAAAAAAAPAQQTAAAPTAEDTGAGANAGKKKSGASRRKKRAAAAAAAAAAASGDTEPDSTDAQTAGQPKLAFNEDFDFEGALKTFDKARIWEEIRRADATDPDTLLVSHNRLGGATNSSEAVPVILKRGPNGVGPSTATRSARLESGDEDGALDGSPRLSSRKAAGAGPKSGKKARGPNPHAKLGIHEMVISPTASDDEGEVAPGLRTAASSTDASSAQSTTAVPATVVKAAEEDEELVTKTARSASGTGEGLLSGLMASAAARMSGFASAARSAMGGSAPPTPTSAKAAGTGADDEDDGDDSILIPSSPVVHTPAAVTNEPHEAAPGTGQQPAPTPGGAGTDAGEADRLRQEVARLLERISVLEAVGGVEVRESSPEELAATASGGASAGSRRWTCTVRPTGAGEGPVGHLRFGLATTLVGGGGGGAKAASASASASASAGAGPTGIAAAPAPRLKTMRYLGALSAPEHSAVDAKEALPAKYANPMGLSADTAGVFVRRLRDGIYGPGR